MGVFDDIIKRAASSAVDVGKEAGSTAYKTIKSNPITATAAGGGGLAYYLANKLPEMEEQEGIEALVKRLQSQGYSPDEIIQALRIAATE